MKFKIKTPAIISWNSKYQALELFDVITLKKLDERKIQLKKTSGYKIPTNDLNPVYQVAIELQRRRPTKFGVSIEIEKAVPTQSGLHSMFSNAAGVLVALNKLWKFDLGEKELLKIAKNVDSRLAKILKHLLNIKSSSKKDVLLIRPKYIQIDPQWIKKKDAFDYFPDLKVIQNEITKPGATDSGLSGIGPTLFGIFEKKPDTESIQKKIGDKIEFIWVGKTCNEVLKLLNLNS